MNTNELIAIDVEAPAVVSCRHGGCMTSPGNDSAGSVFLVEAGTPRHYEMAGRLFREYAEQLRIDLGFQGFAAELQALPLMYGPPSGCLLLVINGATAVGCGGLRRLSDEVCELKRLYIRHADRGAGLARRVAQGLLARARSLGYSTLRLDTLAEMTAARRLYESLGFREIAAYYDNPLPQSVYLELRLADAAPLSDSPPRPSSAG